MLSRRFTLYVIFFAVGLALTGCHSSQRATAVAVSHGSGHSVPALTVPSTGGFSSQAKAIVDEASRWLGTPYKYGGNDRNGVDCSGLVLQVYDTALSIKLPRVSREQKEFCSSTSVAALMPGDLLFFATGREKDRVSHVGIFVGDNRMIHASASKGVIVSDFTEDYYRRTFLGAGYVEQYHAMLGKEKPKHEVPEVEPRTELKQEPKTESKPETKEAPSPVALPIATDARSVVLGSLTEHPL